MHKSREIDEIQDLRQTVSALSERRVAEIAELLQNDVLGMNIAEKLLILTQDNMTSEELSQLRAKSGYNPGSPDTFGNEFSSNNDWVPDESSSSLIVADLRNSWEEEKNVADEFAQ